MQYSLTIHQDHYKVFIYSLNRSVCLSKDIVVTGELITKIEAALKASK